MMTNLIVFVIKQLKMKNYPMQSPLLTFSFMAMPIKCFASLASPFLS